MELTPAEERAVEESRAMILALEYYLEQHSEASQQHPRPFWPYERALTKLRGES